MNNSKVKIIILNWNGKQDTLNCLASLKLAGYTNKNVIVVDNGSVQNDYQEISIQFPQITCIRLRDNLGYAGGVNAALKNILTRDKTDFVLLLNNDLLVDKFFLKNLLAASVNLPQSAITGSVELFYEKKDIIKTIGCNFNKLFFYKTYPYKNKSRALLPKQPIRVEQVAGSSMLIPTSLFTKIGLFDENFFIYGEEYDFSLKAKQAGYKSYAVTNSLVWHKGEASSGGRMSLTGRYYLTRNNILLAKKHLKKIKYYLFIGYYFLFYLPKRILGIVYYRKFSHLKIIKQAVEDGLKNNTGKYHE